MFEEHDPNRIINFRPLFIAAVGFVLGIYAFETLRNLDVSYTLYIVLSVALLLIVFSLGAYAVIRGLKTPLIFAGFFVLAVIRMAVIPQYGSYNGDCLMTGIVDDIPKPGIVILSDVGINNAHVPCKVKLSVKSDGGCPNVGDRIAFNGSAKLPAARFNSYDERLNLLADGIGLKAECEYWKLLSSDNLPVRQGAISLREFFNERIELIFGKNSSIVSGFLLGEKAKVDKEDLESLRETGTAHLLSLSGFHVGLLTAMLFAVLPKRFPWLRLVITGAFLLMYCAVAAFSASIVRASIMCMCLVLSEVTERRRDKRMILTGEEVGAEEALRIGLVEVVVPLEELEARAMKMAKTIARSPAAAVRFAKKGVNLTDEGGLYAGRLFEQAQSTYCCGTEDLQNAIAAYKAMLAAKSKK